MSDSEVDDFIDKGLNLYAEGKKEESLSYFRKAVELRGNVYELHWLGANLSDLGRYEEAFPFLRKAVDLDGDSTDYHWFGTIHCHLERYEEALPYLKKAAELMRQEPELWLRRANRIMRHANYYWLGEALIELGRYKEALPYLRSAVSLADIKENKKASRNKLQLCLDRLPKTYRLIERARALLKILAVFILTGVFVYFLFKILELIR